MQAAQLWALRLHLLCVVGPHDSLSSLVWKQFGLYSETVARFVRFAISLSRKRFRYGNIWFSIGRPLFICQRLLVEFALCSALSAYLFALNDAIMSSRSSSTRSGHSTSRARDERSESRSSRTSKRRARNEGTAPKRFLFYQNLVPQQFSVFFATFSVALALGSGRVIFKWLSMRDFKTTSEITFSVWSEA